MLSDEEKKAIDKLIARREYFEYNKEGCNYYLSFDEWETEEIIDVILNLIEKQTKEIEELKENKEEYIKKLEETKNKLVRYIAVKERKDFEQVCKEFEI